MSKKLYLYIKTHKITGLKYLGKTSQNPFKYKGSGTYWKRHLQKYGDDVITEILLETFDPSEITRFGKEYSEKLDIVNDAGWANLKPEEGDGGYMGPVGQQRQSEKLKGHPNWNLSHTEESKRKISDAQRFYLSTLTDEEKYNRMKQSCSSPQSWTEARKQKISDATVGKTKTKTEKFNESWDARRDQFSKMTTEERQKRFGNRKGKPWSDARRAAQRTKEK